MTRHVAGQAVNKRAVHIPGYVKDPDYGSYQGSRTHAIACFIARAKGDINHRNTQPTRPNISVTVYNGRPFVFLEFKLTKRRREIDRLLFESMKAAHLDVQVGKTSVYVWIPIEHAGYASIALYPESECEMPAKEPKHG